MKKTLLMKITEEVKPSSFLDYKNYLATLFALLKKHTEGYSYMKFAEDLGFSATNVLSHIIQGRRPLTTKSAEVIARSLNLRGVERLYFFTLVDYINAKVPDDKDGHFKKICDLKKEVLAAPIEKEALSYFSEWYHPVIGEMTRLPTFESDPHWIAKNLVAPIRPAQVEKSLDLLENLGIIAFDEGQNRHIRCDRNIATGHEAQEMAVASFHQEMINIGRQSISKVEQEHRDVSAVTVCISKDGIKKIKAMIHEFQLLLLAEEERCQEAEQVYQVNIQFFPLTKIKKRA